MSDTASKQPSKTTDTTQHNGLAAEVPVQSQGVDPYGSIKELHQTAGNNSVSRLLQPKHDQDIEDRVGHSLPEGVARALNHRGGYRLDSSIRTDMESRFGNSFAQVRIHSDSSAAHAADKLGAAAFTYGNSIWFGRNQFSPHEPGGRHLLAHELAHTIQQSRQAPSPQLRPLLGNPNHASEVVADRAADAVLRNRPVPSLGTSPLVIRRRRVTRISSVSRHPNQREVTLDDGSRYRVTRRVSGYRREVRTTWSYRPPRVRGRADMDNIWLQINWCTGLRGQVRIGADVPSALRNVVQEVLGAAVSGGDLGSALEGINLTPFGDFILTQSGGVQVRGGIRVTVDSEGVARVGGEVSLSHGELSGGISASGGRGEERVEVFGRYTPDTQPETFECPRDRRRSAVMVPNIEYECRRYSPPRPATRYRPVPGSEQTSRYIYFDYAKDSIDETTSADELRLLEANLRAGYRVTDIVGFTSPEGPMQPRDPNWRRSGRFRGNEILGQDRAVAARDRIRDICGRLHRGAGGTCFEGGESAVTPRGRGELYTRSESGQEVEGRPLAEHAVGGFQTDPREARHRTPQLMQQLQQRRGDPLRQAELVYPRLRRVVVSLSRSVTRQQPYQVTLPAGWRPVNCDDVPEVLQAARNNFALTRSITSVPRP